MNRSLWLGPVLLLLCGVWLLREPAREFQVVEGTSANRLVSLAPSLTEIVLALGGKDRLVGVTDYCEEVGEEIPRLGGLQFNFERIVALRPDRVLAIETRSQAGLLSALTARGIPVEVLRAESLTDIRHTVIALGLLLEEMPRAEELLEELESAVVVADLEPVPAVFVIQRQPLMVAGGGAFVEEMLRAAGIQNLFSEESWSYRRVELERLIELDPVLILDASYLATDPHAFWGRFDRLQAVRSDGVVSFPPVQPGLQIPEWVEQLREIASTRRL